MSPLPKPTLMLTSLVPEGLSGNLPLSGHSPSIAGHPDSSLSTNFGSNLGTEPIQPVENFLHDQGEESKTGCHDSMGITIVPTSLETLVPISSDNLSPSNQAVLPQDSTVQEDDSDEEHGFWPVLRNFNFLALWGGQVFSQLADKVYLVLMIALIDSRFQAANQPISGWVSSIMIAFTIPAVLFGSVAGVFVDRWSTKTVLVVSNLLRGLLVLSIPLLLWLTQDWSPIGMLPLGFCLLLTITFLVSTLTQFFAPAEQAVIPLIVEHRHLLSANSLYTTTMIGSVVVGFALGEPLLAIADKLLLSFNPAWHFGKEFIVGTAYILAGLLLSSIGVKETIALQNQDPNQEPPHILQDLWDGLIYLKEQYRIRAAMIQLAILSSIFAALSVLAVRLAEVLPEIETAQFGFLLAAAGVGMGVGALVLGSIGKRLGSHRRLSLYGSLGMAIALMTLSFVMNNLTITLLVIAFLGGGAALVGIPMQTTIQVETPEAMRGKVFGLQNNAVNIMLSLPLALAGVAETFLGLRLVFLGLSAIAVLGGLLSWYISRKD